MQPFAVFAQWLHEAAQHSSDPFATACCLSTNGLDDYPNARFVSLKALHNERFIITGCFGSRKGLELRASNKVALSFWWAHVQRQVRIQGSASFLSEAEGHSYFYERPQDAKIVSLICRQGAVLENPVRLQQQLERYQHELAGKEVPPPPHWAAIGIDAIRIEFMQFRQSRLHDRVLYEKKNAAWTKSYLQP